MDSRHETPNTGENTPPGRHEHTPPDPAWAPRGAPLRPPPDLQARLRAEVVRSPSPKTSLRARLLVAALVLPLALLVGPLGRQLLYGRAPFRVDLGSMSVFTFVLQMIAVAALALAVSYVAVAPGRRGLGAPARALFWVAVAAAPVYAIVTSLYPLDAGEVTAHAAARLHPFGFPCAMVSSAVGTSVLAVFLFALRGAVPVAPSLRGAALGAAAGAWAGVVLVTHCPANDARHLLVGHALPIAVFAALGFVVGPRVLRP